MGKEPNDNRKDKQPKDMDGREMLLRIIELTGARERTDGELLQILEAIEKIVSKPKGSSR